MDTRELDRWTTAAGAGHTVQPESESPYLRWRPHEYYGTYYRDGIVPDEQLALAYQIQILERAEHPFAHGLEYGSGPTMHRAIAAARYASRIDMSDWLPDNLRQVSAWLDRTTDGQDWHHYTKHILEQEGTSTPSPSDITAREELTRRTVNRLYLSDARARDPLGPQHRGHYDLVISGFCIDAISDSKEIWRACMRNVLSTLRADGLLVMHALHRCSSYRVGDLLFPCANVSADDLSSSLLENGFVRSSIDIQVASWGATDAFGYSEILLVSGRKA